MTNLDIIAKAFPGVADPEDPTSMFRQLGDVYSALAWRFLFRPDCLVVHDCVFLALNGNDVAYVGGRLDPLVGNVDEDRWREAVASFNFYEVPYLFGSPRKIDGATTERAYDDVATALRDAWSARLAQRYPRRSFEVTLD